MRAIFLCICLISLTAISASACGTLNGYGSAYFYADAKSDMGFEDRQKCKIGLLAALMCVPGKNLLVEENAGAMLAALKNNAARSPDARITCMAKELFTQLKPFEKHIKLQDTKTKTDWSVKGDARFETICNAKNLNGHPPFGVRTFGPGKRSRRKMRSRITGISYLEKTHRLFLS